MMHRRLGSSTFLRMLSVLALTGLPIGCSRETPRPEQIVLVVVDTLRRDHLSCYLGQIPTPNIDAIAARGEAHPDYLASFHQTTMSMAALFTGRTPSLETGVQQKPLPWNGRTWCGLTRFRSGAAEEGAACIPDSLTTLGEALAKAGYWTAGVVSNELLYAPAGFQRGFDHWRELRPEADPLSDARAFFVRAEAVNAAVSDALANRPGDRLFLYVHYMDVHDYRLRRRPYGEMVARVDAAIGELKRMLEAQGLLDDALLIVVSDHGETISEQHLVQGGSGHLGNPSADELLRLPLVMSRGGLADAGRPLRSEDLFHLIVTVAGADAGGEDRSALGSDELYLSELHWQTYRTGRWKSFRQRQTGAFHLFDLEQDPMERTDLATREPDVSHRHRKRIDALQKILAAEITTPGRLSEEDQRRLRALGYLE